VRSFVLVILLGLGPVANATSLQYDFSYTFADGEQLSGSVLGTLQGDGDTIAIDGLLEINYSAALSGDCCLPSPEYDSLNDWNGEAATLSFSGANMLLESGNPGDPLDYWAISSVNVAIFDEWFDITCGGVCGDWEQFEAFDSANWHITAIPVPPALLLYASGLVLLGWLRRQK
jgi:hypothetical protein